jgi:hypothetical protein
MPSLNNFKKMKKNLAIFYHNLKNRGNEIPYVLTLAFFVFSLGIHWFQAVIIFDIPQSIYSPIQLDNTRSTRWVNSLVFFTPVFIASLIFFKKSSLEEYKFTVLELRNGYRKLAIYMALSIAILMGLLIREGIKKGQV